MNQSGKLLLGLALFMGLLCVVTVAGLLAGEWSVPKRAILVETVDEASPVSSDNETPRASADGNDVVEEESAAAVAPPLYFSLAPTKEGDWSRALEEVAMASSSGVHRYVVPIQFTWDDAGPGAVGLDAAKKIIEIDARASLLLRVDLNPDVSWLEAHPGEVVAGKYPKLGSTSWRESVRIQIVALQKSVAEGNWAGRVEGYVLTALADGQWHYSAGESHEALDLSGFRNWLAGRYDDDAALAAAWGEAAATIEGALFPEAVNAASDVAVFLPPEGRQKQVAALRYLSQVTVDTIALFTSTLKRASSSESVVLVPYGFTFEVARSDTGHFALGDLLSSEVDGFVSPVSYRDRGLGGVGGPMGPIDSARYHGKSWYLVDDTRTGMGLNADSGAMERMRGVRAEDVFNVQRRNFGMAVTHGAGIFWSDPNGEGWLHGAEQWEALGVMSDAYAQHGGAAVDTRGADSSSKPTLMVVVDEDSRLYMEDVNPMSAGLIWKTRDAALGVGVSTHFALLRDVLDGHAPTASVYLFVNAFTLYPEDRDLLHARLEKEKACAVWMYAPSYFSADDGASSITATTTMNVLSFEEVAESGSVYDLEGQWLKKGDKLGERRSVAPLFYIEDEAADVLTRYQATGKASAAIRFMEGGWSSVYVADPQMSTSLLREILSILELHLYFRSTVGIGDTIHVGEGLVMLHARRSGERAIDLGGRFNVSDLLDMNLGWPDNDSLVLPMTTGETRLLRLLPLAETQ